MQADYHVTPPARDGDPYLVTKQGGSWLVDTLKDECSCAAMQGIACEHKTAVDEYVEQQASQIITDAAPAPEVQTQPATASHNPKYERQLAGMTNTTPRRPFYAYTVRCSCGWVFTVEPESKDQGVTKDMARDIFRGHKRQAENTTPPPIYKTREEWLNEGARHIQDRAALLQLGDNPPPIRVACGFTYGRGTRIGECWRKEQSGDGTFEIIVHNKIDDPAMVLGILAHEIGHAYMPAGTGHSTPFKRWARTMGFSGPFAEYHPGEELVSWLTQLAGTLGTFPHAALDSRPQVREGGPKRQTNRWLKYVCEDPGCGWIVRVPKAGYKGACLGDAHENEPRLMVPGFTIETEVTPSPEDDDS